MSYKITRFWFEDKPSKVIERGLTLEEAQEHCSREDTHCNSEHTKDTNKWFFDGYDEEIWD